MSLPLRRRLAALGVVGALMVALPLVQVLRFQNAEVQSLLGERAGLDPVARAVEVQRGLLAHADLAADVLRGQTALEPQRLQRQGEVDGRVAALSMALLTGQWERAVQESDALRDDWMLLARQVAARSLDAGESDQAHRLLMEQTLQVIDLVGDSALPHAERGVDRLLPAAATARALPRLAWQLARLSMPGAGNDADSARRDVADAEADLARTLGRLNTALARNEAGHSDLAGASAKAGALADRYIRQLRSLGSRHAETRAAGAAAVRAQFALFRHAHEVAAAALDMQLATAERQRNQLLAALAALGLLALGLAAQVLRLLRNFDTPQAPTPLAAPYEPTQRPAASREAAGRVLQRLRDGDSPAASLLPGAARSVPQRAGESTLPPER
jgi:hypothetical protein